MVKIGDLIKHVSDNSIGLVIDIDTHKPYEFRVLMDDDIYTEYNEDMVVINEMGNPESY